MRELGTGLVEFHIHLQNVSGPQRSCETAREGFWESWGQPHIGLRLRVWGFGLRVLLMLRCLLHFAKQGQQDAECNGPPQQCHQPHATTPGEDATKAIISSLDPLCTS